MVGGLGLVRFAWCAFRVAVFSVGICLKGFFEFEFFMCVLLWFGFVGCAGSF